MILPKKYLLWGGIGAVLALVALAPTASAQRRVVEAGDWSAEMTLDSDFAGLALLHYRSETRAWRFGGEFLYGEGLSGVSDGASSLTVTARVGIRTHHEIDEESDWYRAFGVLATYDRDVLPSAASTRALTLSPFMQIGATWYITPHLGMSARGQAEVHYTRFKGTLLDPDAEGSSWGFGVSAPAFFLLLIF